MKTRNRYYTFKIGSNKFCLPYRITTYQEVVFKDRELAKKYKKHLKNKNIKYNQSDKGDRLVIKKIICDKYVDLQSRYKLINSILDSKFEDTTLIEYIKYKWATRNYHKTTNTELMDSEAILLDILSSYAFAGFEEGILTQNNISNIKKREKYNLEDFNDNKIIKVEPLNAKQTKTANKRWKQSNTYRLGKVFYNSKIRYEYDWSIVRKDWIKYELQEKYQDGLIDKNKPYIAKWCHVDTEGVFEFEGVKYRVGSNNYDYDENKWCQDKILITEQDGNRYHFDMNIGKISDREISKV